jgi:NAD(P)-dependent dehydrogenase (short-subunit alcohol dehydrogenase family)
MGHLTGKVALISGGASGIGRAIALLFAQEGAAVSVADLDAAGAERVIAEIAGRGGQGRWLACDVTCATDCRQAAEGTLEAYGRLDILCNSAGIIRRASVLECSEEDWDRVMAVNVRSVFLLSKFAIPAMAQGGGGVIINIASGWGLVGGSQAAAYCASKAAVVNLTRALALDHARQGIRANCICPGDTDTPMLREEAKQLGLPEQQFLSQAAGRPLGRIGRPDDIAHAALYLAGDTSSFVTGAILVVDGGGLAG